jgi:hypothetical protein
MLPLRVREKVIDFLLLSRLQPLLPSMDLLIMGNIWIMLLTLHAALSGPKPERKHFGEPS